MRTDDFRMMGMMCMDEMCMRMMRRVEMIHLRTAFQR